MRKFTYAIIITGIRVVLDAILCAAACIALILWLTGCSCGSASGTQSGNPSGSISAESDSSGDGGLLSEAPAGSEYNMTETVIVDRPDCSFTVTSASSGSSGFTVRAKCENRSDRPLMFSWDECSVNGWMSDPFWAREVTAGNSANVEITFDRRQLERCGIETVEEIEFELHIYDSENWDTDPLVDEDYTIYPTGKSADNITIPQRVSKESETVFVNSDQCVFVVESADPDGLLGYTLLCYLENRTDDSLMFSWGDTAVNGLMIDPFWAAEIDGGKRAYAEISFSDSDFETNGITDVDQIEFRLRVYDADDWDERKDITNEVFTYVP